MARVKLSSQVTIPASVVEAQTTYKKARSGLWRKAYFGQIAERTKSMWSDFKIHKALGVIFTILPFRLGHDYLKSRKALRSKLDLIGQTISIEMARDPALRKSLEKLAKSYPYLSVNRKGEIFLSSFSGSILDKSTVFGKIFNPETSNLQRKEINASNQAFGQKLNLKALLSRGNPKFEKAKIISRGSGSAVTPAKNVTATLMGNNEIRIFTRTVTAGVTRSKDRIITPDQVRSKKIVDGPAVTPPATPTKILLLRVKEAGKPVELIRLELEAKKADAMFKGFVIKK